MPCKVPEKSIDPLNVFPWLELISGVSGLRREGLTEAEINEWVAYIVGHQAECNAAHTLLSHGYDYSQNSDDFALAMASQIVPFCFKQDSPKPPKPAPAQRRRRIYVMANHRTGLFKIGVSVRPNDREKTLQSEEPELELLCDWPGTLDDERKLQTEYAAKRVRGEWFRLSPADLESIITTAKGAAI